MVRLPQKPCQSLAEALSPGPMELPFTLMDLAADYETICEVFVAMTRRRAYGTVDVCFQVPHSRLTDIRRLE